MWQSQEPIPEVIFVVMNQDDDASHKKAGKRNILRRAANKIKAKLFRKTFVADDINHNSFITSTPDASRRSSSNHLTMNQLESHTHTSHYSEPF